MVDQSASPPVSSPSDCDRTLEVRDKARRSNAADAANTTSEIGIEDIVEVQAAVSRLTSGRAAKAPRVEGTQELGGDDILEVENVARKLDVAPPPSQKAPPVPAARPSMPSISTAGVAPPVPKVTRSVPPPPPPPSKQTKQLAAAPVSKKTRVPAGNAKLSDVFGTITPKKLREMEEEGVFGAASAESIMAPYQGGAPAAAPVEYVPQAQSATPPPFVADMNHLVSGMPQSVPPPPMFQPEPRDPYPSSIAPIAFDVAPVPQQRPAYRSNIESTSEIVRAAGIPQRPIWQVAVGIAGAVVFSAMGMGFLTGGFSHSHSSPSAASVAPDDMSASASTSSSTHRSASFARGDEQLAQIPPVPQAQQVAPPSDVTAPAPIAVMNVEPVATEAPTVLVGGETLAPPPFVQTHASHSAKRNSVAITANVAPTTQGAQATQTTQSAPSRTVAASSSNSAASGSSKAKSSAGKTGELRMPSSVNGALVDGAPHKVVGGEIVLACGAHKVKVPMHPARTVNVPCGGSTQF